MTLTAAATATPTVPPATAAEKVLMSSRLVAATATPRTRPLFAAAPRMPTVAGLASLPGLLSKSTELTFGALTRPCVFRLPVVAPEFEPSELDSMPVVSPAASGV